MVAGPSHQRLSLRWVPTVSKKIGLGGYDLQRALYLAENGSRCQ
jgi:hypothetical protein